MCHREIPPDIEVDICEIEIISTFLDCLLSNNKHIVITSQYQLISTIKI